MCKLKDGITKELQTENTFLRENVRDEVIGMKSDLVQSRKERQELKKTMEQTTAYQEMTKEKIAEMNQKFEDLLKTERPHS